MRLSVICLLLMMSLRKRAAADLDIHLTAILPRDPDRLFSIGKVSSAASMAIERIHNMSLLARGSIRISYRDSKCSEVYGMKEAIESFIRNNVSAFFGPVCDYAAAPVARQTRFWNLPMVSVGAIALDFYKRRRQIYPLLTRAGPASLLSLADSFLNLFRTHRWHHFKVLYEQDAHSDIIEQFGHLTSVALVYGIPSEEIKLDYFKLDGASLPDVLPKEVGRSYAGKRLNSNPVVSGSANSLYAQ